MSTIHYVAVPKKRTRALAMEYVQSFARRSISSARKDAKVEERRTGKPHEVLAIALYVCEWG